jgi:hypothetical protein
MEALVLAGFVVLGLALVGLIAILRLMFGRAREPRGGPVLDDAQKVDITREILIRFFGTRAPAELMRELAQLQETLSPAWQGRPPPPARPAAAAPAPLAAPSVVSATAVPAPGVAAAAVGTGADAAYPSAAGAVSAAAADVVQALGDAAGGAVLIEDDRPLAPTPQVAAAAAHAHPLLRSFLSFENVIFLLAACLVLGGTLYVVAISWARVPGRWQYLFLEGVILFYGVALLAAAVLLDRRLRLAPAARFLSATAGLITVAAAVVAVAAFVQHIPAGIIGAALVGVAGAGVARAVLRIAGRATRSAPLFGLSLLLLAAAGGLVAVDRPALAAVTLLAATAVACALWAGGVDRPPPAVLSLAGAVPVAAALLPVADWLPAPYIAPSLAAAAALGGGLEHLGAAMPLALGAAAVLAAAFGFAASSIGLVAATALTGWPIALALAARAPHARQGDAAADAGARGLDAPTVGALLAGVLWLVLAFTWARAVGLIDGTMLARHQWAWTGAAALPFSLLPFAVAAAAARGGARADGARAVGGEAAAWAIVAGALAMALPAPGTRVGAPSVAVGAGAAALAYAWAHRRGASDRAGDPRWLVAHALAALAIWIGARAALPGAATPMLAVMTAAAAAQLLPRLPSARVAGTLVLPLAAIAAAGADGGAPRLWLAGGLAAFALAHLLRPLRAPAFAPSDGAARAFTTRPLGPPAALAALGVALFYAGADGAALLPLHDWPLALVLALAPMAAWVMWTGGPLYLTIETLTGVALAAAGGGALGALAMATALLFGRAPGALAAAAPVVGLLAVAAMGQRAPGAPIGACLLAAGVLFLRRPFGPRLIWIRWLGPPALVAAVAVLAFYATGRGHAPQLPFDLWPVVLAAAVAPFAVHVVRRGGPDFVRVELLLAAPLLAAAALLDALGADVGSRAAILAGAGGAAALAIGLGAARRTGGGVARAGWIVALLLAPVAAVPTADTPVRAHAAAVAVAAVLGLGVVSRRLRATDIGAVAVAAGLAAAWWALAAVAKQFSTGAPPAHILPLVATVTALYGIASVNHLGTLGGFPDPPATDSARQAELRPRVDARRLAHVAPPFVRAFGMTALALTAAAALAGVGLVDGPEDRDVVLTLVAFVAVGALALVLAFRYRRGWPFLVAESLLAVGYGYLRAFTPWLRGVGDWDGVAACAGGFACFAAERWLRRTRAQLGASESRGLATVFPLLSALLLSSGDPRAAIGMGASAGLYLAMAVMGAGQRFGWLAALLANLSLARAWASAGVAAPIAYALPPAGALMLLAHVYRARLGERAAALRTVASLLVFASTSYQMFQFDAVWPAAVMAGAAVALILLGIHTRARAYLYLGFAALLLDIVANLTRWGMRDRMTAGVLGVAGGIAMFALGIAVARHKEAVLARYRRVAGWRW